MEIELLDNILESLLFVSGDGLKITDICELMGVQRSEINGAIKRLKARYCDKCGIHLISYNGKIQFGTNPAYSDQVSSVLNPIKERKLSSSAIETIAIIAYSQPVTRLDIESIRGTNPEYAINVLLENKLIEAVGRKDTIGKPILYGTTEEFLKRFNIESLDHLPDYEQLLDNLRIIESKRKDTADVDLYNRDNSDIENPDFLKDEDVQMVSADENGVVETEVKKENKSEEE